REKYVRLDGKGAGNSNALAHTSGQFVRLSIGEIAEAQSFEPGKGAFVLFGLWQADEVEWKARIVERRTPRQEAVLLEDGRDFSAEMIEIGMWAFIADADRTLGGRVETDHQIEESRFATTGLPDDRHHLARGNIKIKAVNRDDRLASCGLAKNLAQAADFVRWRTVHERHRNTRASTRATTPSSRNSSATSTSVQANTSATENSSWATDS